MTTTAGTKGVPRADRERLILDAAVTEFGTQGYAHASLPRIAEAAGISKAMIYSYFESKDGLYLACVHEAGEAIVEQVTAAQVSADPVRRATDTLAAIFATLEPRRLDWAVLYDATLPLGSAVHETALHYRRTLNSIGGSATSELLAAGGDHDDADAALATHLWVSAVASAVRWWLDHPAEDAASMMQRITRILTALSGTSPSSG